jgi:hypothetical protein
MRCVGGLICDTANAMFSRKNGIIFLQKGKINKLYIVKNIIYTIVITTDFSLYCFIFIHKFFPLLSIVFVLVCDNRKSDSICE